MALAALSRLCASHSLARTAPALFTPTTSLFANRNSVTISQQTDTLKVASFGLRTIQTQAEENTQKELQALKKEIVSLKEDVSKLKSKPDSFLTASDWFLLLGLTVFGAAVIGGSGRSHMN